MISYEPPKQEVFGVGDYIEGLGTVSDPDDEEMVALMENVAMKDDTDYINGSSEPHAHLNACGTGELTVFIDPSKVTALTLIGDETRHYDLTDRGAGFDEAKYRRVCQLLEEATSLMSEWGCNELPDMRNRL